MKLRFVFTFLLLVQMVGRASAPNDSLIAYVFLAEGCPICQSITPELNAIHAKYASKAFRLIGVFPSALSDSLSRSKFARKYKIKFGLVQDTGAFLTQKYEASITPEVILVNSSTNTIIYRGLVDDSFAAVGKRRKVSKYQYLSNAIELFFTTFESSAFTEPVGCKITLKP